MPDDHQVRQIAANLSWVRFEEHADRAETTPYRISRASPIAATARSSRKAVLTRQAIQIIRSQPRLSGSILLTSATKSAINRYVSQ